MKNRARTWSISISSLGILATLWLSANELNTAGHCPPYPLLGIPACYLVLVFFSFVLGAHLVNDKKISSLMFYSGALAGLGTAIWFSINQILDTAHCPVELGIPLCFVALLTFTTLIVLRRIKY
jgi:hypothetical protein